MLELEPAALDGALEVALLDGTLDVLDGALEVELGEAGAPTLGDAVPGDLPVLSLLLCANAPHVSASSAPAVAAAIRLRFMQRLLSWRVGTCRGAEAIAIPLTVPPRHPRLRAQVALSGVAGSGA